MLKIKVMIEAHLYKKLYRKKVKCLNCSHYCIIPDKRRGICGVRENQAGKLYSLNYGKAVALNIDPIEKKPLFHFLPGSFSLSFGAAGCNFRCLNCQNWDISQSPSLNKKIQDKEMSPGKIVAEALNNKLPSISYTYTEPAVFSEYALETMKIAKTQGLKNCWITNGYWSKELFDLIVPYLDAVNVDLKGFTDNFYAKNCGAKLKPVLETLKKLKKKNVWIEITTLVIPSLNDSEKSFKDIAEFIKDNLGEETPWHISRFSPDISWKLNEIPETPIKTLQKAYNIGKEAGLKYVYTGNAAGLISEDTFCPHCGALVIDRLGYKVKRFDKNGYCPKCKEYLNIKL